MSHITKSESHSDGESAVETMDEYEKMCAHMTKYAGRVPRIPAHAAPQTLTDNVAGKEGEALAVCCGGVPPYTFSGCDYALVLHASFPRRCIDLTRLCWASRPITTQLNRNLEVFIEACMELALPEATKPCVSLSSECLQPTPACVVHHIRVREWLYGLAKRFPPDPANPSAVEIRTALSYSQFGEPFAHFNSQRLSAMLNSKVESCAEPHPYCASVQGAPLLDLPAEVLKIEEKIKAEEKEEEEEAEREKLARKRARHEPTGTAQVSKTPALDGSNAPGQARKPWNSTYNKPWRTNVRRKTPDDQNQEDAGGRKKADGMSAHNETSDGVSCGENGDVTWHRGARNLEEQYRIVTGRLARLREGMREVERSAQQTLIETGSLDFDVIRTMLENLSE